ncbi:MAG TPA: T9SS type A sorting domain-containing protein [Saprospiraceae bacterium]|nr:T9SS type A sorting domain-containing protein [Saprospiraceae bacterium]HMQ84766.1 T9SS type A sorting domain-containing protein [Saprospiraceae bacterium]
MKQIAIIALLFLGSMTLYSQVATWDGSNWSGNPVTATTIIFNGNFGPTPPAPGPIVTFLNATNVVINSPFVVNVRRMILNNPLGSIYVASGAQLYTRRVVIGSASSNHTGYVTYFGETTIDSNNNLPVELVSFELEGTAASVVVRWTTASEINNNYFDVERSADGIEWKSLGKVEGAGNSVEKRDYTFIDGAPLTGISYYRLKQVDFDGKFEYPAVEAIEITGNTTVITPESATVFPNPFVKDITIVLPGSVEDVNAVELYNLQGQKVAAPSWTSNNTNMIYVTFDNQLEGNTFFLMINTDKGVETIAVFKQ